MPGSVDGRGRGGPGGARRERQTRVGARRYEGFVRDAGVDGAEAGLGDRVFGERPGGSVRELSSRIGRLSRRI
jgi:hypothetical protein